MGLTHNNMNQIREISSSQMVSSSAVASTVNLNPVTALVSSNNQIVVDQQTFRKSPDRNHNIKRRQSGMFIDNSGEGGSVKNPNRASTFSNAMNSNVTINSMAT